MKRAFIGLCIAFLGFSAYADINPSQNWNGILDTANVVTFRADTLRYCKAYPLSQYENLRIDLLINDTTAAGFADDSINCIWGIQLGHVLLNASRTLDTIWSGQLIIVDTLNADSTSGYVGPVYTGPIDSTGTYYDKKKRLDTSYVTGYIVQTRAVSPAYDVLFRPWIKGLTGNKVGEFLNGRFNIVRRAAIRTRAQ